MKLLQEQAGHTCDASFAGVGPTVQFMDTVHRWFVLMDVSYFTHHIHQKNADCKQFESAGDERLIWLETSFLDYPGDLKNTLEEKRGWGKLRERTQAERLGGADTQASYNDRSDEFIAC
ncbi:hypothetical protein HPB49_008360 [Dermacentor silvarum]|uniref:Uncharacterized protein n=1 Tax=Dermacentor silvarum TaxID=543639 RepID=A0ACB8DBX1_DERSI|nr:hypothetical protein HPB49_008360 [Dermacentor silvarum]